MARQLHRFAIFMVQEFAALQGSARRRRVRQGPQFRASLRNPFAFQAKPLQNFFELPQQTGRQLFAPTNYLRLSRLEHATLTLQTWWRLRGERHGLGNAGRQKGE